jgi:hypothetical protein
MKKSIKKKWVAALRSGEYEQGTGKLRDGDTYCCLGVLCDIHRKETGGRWRLEKYRAENLRLPDEVVSWAGLKSKSPAVFYENEDQYLSVLNDDIECNFDQIADAIEENL